jgi:hypothetical protein
MRNMWLLSQEKEEEDGKRERSTTGITQKAALRPGADWRMERGRGRYIEYEDNFTNSSNNRVKIEDNWMRRRNKG